MHKAMRMMDGEGCTCFPTTPRRQHQNQGCIHHLSLQSTAVSMTSVGTAHLSNGRSIILITQAVMLLVSIEMKVADVRGILLPWSMFEKVWHLVQSSIFQNCCLWTPEISHLWQRWIIWMPPMWSEIHQRKRGGGKPKAVFHLGVEC